MLMLISPAKTLNNTFPTHSALARLAYSQPSFMKEAQQLIAVLHRYSVGELAQLMDISLPLAELNHQRYQDFTSPLTEHNAIPAIFAFKGDVYRPLALDDYDENTLRFMNQHLRILSGLYGLLKPLDYLYPYRLEMGTSLACGEAKNLYQFWSKKITQAIDQAASEAGAKTIINLASQEYFKAVDMDALAYPLINVEFKEKQGDAYRLIGVHAKAARGMMVDFITRHHITEVDALKTFNTAHYHFSVEHSNARHMVFVR
jgi:uncharacterized protein